MTKPDTGPSRADRTTPEATLGRRRLLAAMVGAPIAGAVAGGAGLLGAGAAAAATQPPIRPRQDWAQGKEPTGAMTQEAAGDIRFLLVHHTQTPNGYEPGEGVARQLRSMFEYHTGPKGWPDIAYNFLVDAQGTIWEGRSGSLAGPVRGDATGGSQGFAQLCCFIGDHTSEPPSAAAQAAMGGLLGWLASRYAINLHAGPTITFVSRGSNRWPAGQTVTTDPVAGHRDMSQTECPGDACYPLVRTALLTAAQAAAGTPPPAGNPNPTVAGPNPAGPNPAPPVVVPTLPAPTTTATASPSATGSATSSATAAATVPGAGAPGATGGDGGFPAAAVTGGTAAAAVIAGAVALGIRRRRTPVPEPTGGGAETT